MKSLTTFLSALLMLIFVFSVAIAESDNSSETLYYESRADIPIEYTWDMSLVYETDEAFEADFTKLETMINGFKTYNGHLSDSYEMLATGLNKMFTMKRIYSNLEVYSNQIRDLDIKNAEATDRFLRVDGLYASLDQAISFIEPEISTIPDDVLKKWRKKKPLKTYAHYLDNLARMKPHVQSAEVEEVLAASGLLGNTPKQVWGNMISADIEWPTIKDSEGEDRLVIPSLYYQLVSDQDRNLRRDAALSLFDTYTKFGNTFASVYNGHVQKDIFITKTRGYERTLDRVLNNVNVPTAIVDNLVSTVHDNIELMHRYASLRKRVLGIDEFHVYDLYVPMVAEAQKHYSYEDAKVLALGFWEKTFGEEYATVAAQAFNERWVDVYVNDGKRGGAYSWGTYDSVPYLLLNWGGTLEDVFTLVHEMGHSIHTYMAYKNQPYHDADYSLFVAEVASVTSEALFLEYMLDRTVDPTERLDLLNLYLNNITGTFLRQIFFHEFEDKAHIMAENGESLTKHSLGEMYGNLWKEYYGPELVLDDEFKAGWSRVSHFYRTYYVYVYATSFAAGEGIAQRFRSGDDKAVQGYLDLLKLGGSVYPMDALKTAGVDLADPSVIRTVMVRYEETLSEMEKLFEARGK
jgi:oligoendopeptidase F